MDASAALVIALLGVNAVTGVGIWYRLGGLTENVANLKRTVEVHAEKIELLEARR